MDSLASTSAFEVHCCDAHVQKYMHFGLHWGFPAIFQWYKHYIEYERNIGNDSLPFNIWVAYFLEGCDNDIRGLVSFTLYDMCDDFERKNKRNVHFPLIKRQTGRMTFIWWEQHQILFESFCCDSTHRDNDCVVCVILWLPIFLAVVLCAYVPLPNCEFGCDPCAMHTDACNTRRLPFSRSSITTFTEAVARITFLTPSAMRTTKIAFHLQGWF